MANLVLIGMPGAGKSTVGVVLAKTLGMEFVDTDLIIQRRENKMLQEIIREVGVKGFLEIEKQAVTSVYLDRCVIATGGSVVYHAETMVHLKRNGTVIYLKLPYEYIRRRIRNIKTRGIAMGKGQNLHSIYHERTPLYEQYADLVIDCRKKRVEQVVEAILAALPKE